MGQLAWVKEHIEQYRKDPQKGHMWDSTVVEGPGPVPCLLLTTVGRKSGKDRVSPLIYGEADGGYTIIASKGGAPDHPDWYLNLVENPEVTIQVAEKVMSARAETVEGPEREGLWKAMVEIWPAYEDYQQGTERQIPVVFLKPNG